MLVHGVDDLIVRDVTSGNNGDVVSVVVGCVVGSHVVNGQSLSKISISLDWLSNHVLSVRVEVGVFDGGLFVSLVVVLVLSANFVLKELKLSLVKRIVADDITKQANGSSGVTAEDLKSVASELSIRVSVPSGSEVFNFLTELSLGFAGGSSESHLLKKVGSSSSLKGLVSGSRADVDSYAEF